VQESKFFTAIALFLLVFSFLALIARPDKTPGPAGDGFEYLSMTRAFIARLEPSVRFAEAETMVRDPKNAGTLAGIAHHLDYDLLRDMTLQPDRQRAHAWFRGRDGGI
jgi:hypothetical protein